MAARKAVYFVVVSGISITDAIGTPALIAGPCNLRSEVMKAAQDVLPANDSGYGYEVVKAHFDIVDSFSVAPVTVAAFVRS